MAEKNDLDIVKSWIKNTHAGSPNGHFSSYNDISTPASLSRNAEILANTIAHVYRCLE